MIRYEIMLVLSMFALGASAQNPIPHQHAAFPADLIDGRTNPERIPDSVAYRTYFLGRATKLDDPEKTRYLNDLKVAEIGLDAWDLKALTKGIADFYLKYEALTEQHNRQAEIMEARHAC